METLQLKKSLKHGEKEVKSLEFRSPTFRDVKNIKISEIDNFSSIVEITARITGYPQSVFNDMDISDLIGCTRIVTSFLAPSQEISEKFL